MKIVQSWWSKPGIKKGNSQDFDRTNGGWNDRKYYYLSLAMSCLQLRKFYDKVELVTDEMGYEFLIDKLELPYTSVKVVLDDLNHYPPNLYALGKIHAYQMQDEPFLHVDNDVYIWENFESKLKKSPLQVQSMEGGLPYFQIVDKIKKTFEYVPDVVIKGNKGVKDDWAINAGIIGGYDIDFFKMYTEMAIKFVNRNLHCLDEEDIGTFNLVFEQHLFLLLAEEKNIDVNYYYYNPNHNYDDIAEFSDVPKKTKYIHTLCNYKKKKVIENHLDYRMLIDYPDYYFRIKSLLENYKI